MKKIVYTLIALFIYGGMCRAQETQSVLKAGQNKLDLPKRELKKSDKRNNAPALIPQAEGDMYWFRGTNPWNNNGMYMYYDEKGVEMMYPVYVKIDGDKAYISNLLNIELAGYEWLEQYPVEGTYEAANKRIVIDTPEYDRTLMGDYSSYLPLGTIDYWGEVMTIVLFSGNYVYDEDWRDWGLVLKNRLVLNISDDGKTITPADGFAGGCFYTASYGPTYSGIAAAFHKDATMQLCDETPNIVVNPSVWDFTDKYAFAGGDFQYEVQVGNASTSATTISIASSAPEILKPSVSNFSLAGGETATCRLDYTPQEPGDSEIIVYLTDSEGKMTHVSFKGKANEDPHFEQIVTAGDFSFETSPDFPFEIVTDEATGTPMLTSTNSGDYTESALYVRFNVPDGCTGLLSWKGHGYATMPNSIAVFLDMESKYNVSNMDPVGYEALESYPVEAGDHLLEFHNAISMDWHLMYDDPEVKFYLENLDLQIMTTADDAAALNPSALDFGRHYHDKYSVRDSRTVNLINTGRNDLKVLDIQGDGCFSGIVPDIEAETLENLPVEITFTADAPGEYTGNVVLKTTAGDFNVECSASAETIPTDFNPLVKEGEFSFNTSLTLPFEMIGSCAYSTIEPSKLDVLGLPCWLEAEFIVPEGSQMELNFQGYNSSWPFFNFAEQIILTDGTIIYFDGDEIGRFAGETAVRSSDLDKEFRTFGPGRHVVRFEYIRKSSEAYSGDDRFELSSLSISPATSVLSLGSENDVVATRWYSLDGLLLPQQPTNGPAIKIETLANGLQRTSKVMFNK